MHRNTYLVVSALAVLAALIVGVNVGKKISPATPSGTPTPLAKPDPAPQDTPIPQTYTDVACGFSVQYGSDFTVMASATGSAILNNATDKNKSIVMTCQKAIPLPAITAGNTESLTINTINGASVSAKLYHDQSAQNGTPIDALIFTHPTNKLDVFIAGYGDAFNALIKTIQIIP